MNNLFLATKWRFKISQSIEGKGEEYATWLQEGNVEEYWFQGVYVDEQRV